MWFTKFLDIMNSIIPVSIPAHTLENLSRLDPNKFYVENVRSLLGVSTDKAKNLCDTAVRQGFFMTGIELICPDGSVVKSIDKGEEIPKKVNCILQVDNGYEDVEFKIDELERNTYYRLNKKEVESSSQNQRVAAVI